MSNINLCELCPHPEEIYCINCMKSTASDVNLSNCSAKTEVSIEEVINLYGTAFLITF